jgi:hypothetical protein
MFTFAPLEPCSYLSPTVCTACVCVVWPPQVKDPLTHVPPPPLNADPLWCEVRGIAGYPTVTFEDVRVVSSSVGVAQYLRLVGLESVMAPPRAGVVKRRGSTVIRWVQSLRSLLSLSA